MFPTVLFRLISQICLRLQIKYIAITPEKLLVIILLIILEQTNLDTRFQD